VRRNRLRELLLEDRPLVGVFVSIPSAALVEYCGLIGFDWICLDAEHGGITPETCYELVRAADAVGLASVVQAPSKRPDVLLGYAETGASAIIGPHVTSAEEARSLVSALRFPPAGSRGVSAGSRAANYGITQTATDYLTDTTNTPIVAALLEDVEAYEHLGEILAEPGIEMFSLGHGDLAASMGHPGLTRHPDVVARIEQAAAVLREHGKAFEMPTSDGASARHAIALGARFVQVGLSTLFAAAAREYLSVVALGDRTAHTTRD
jgi:4-hydroxy-2-oxoheptanedioate aldolase